MSKEKKPWEEEKSIRLVMNVVLMMGIVGAIAGGMLAIILIVISSRMNFVFTETLIQKIGINCIGSGAITGFVLGIILYFLYTRGKRK